LLAQQSEQIPQARLPVSGGGVHHVCVNLLLATKRRNSGWRRLARREYIVELVAGHAAPSGRKRVGLRVE